MNALSYRWATAADSAQLARLNQQLVREGADFGPDDLPFLQSRMHAWLSSGAYRAVIFGDEDGRTVAYAVFRESADEIYLAQFLVLRHARRHGVGHAAIDRLRREIWRSGKRLTLDVLVQNRRALEFWHQLGWRDCALTLEIPVADALASSESTRGPDQFAGASGSVAAEGRAAGFP